ncbi:MAG: flagellar protein FliL [Zetaproteobacteria bacterium CG12_big_fil_rev_8_21_14_0_65_55_1124]|nr:MAG: flagellar protein FliL [Zetaproteobacteria bacterium CG1_02_55_237]PIS18687.1 MAG: flagellar protein FliL [Zetaproteobacteria bacterium CG08_land_8_20_14_0_20_55_17]PIW43291.1 MAG: flagellar protein FliL [Zetaproteobacteria bacterium CG12_big_fil_rev_8_21_14_0_65_55_1124]PIY53422.1 MAG: flagellar protein FliL [Zetaproteobacteria bacterium CG_4_10_14_0_8_um_filter_55_43]PIZ38675.1 MAG: flagellar protein FliL [Zetaproteobacteria bacterium CG_4_10_14_0_2_um_filter_55_20]PJB82539.1 MAG: fl
MADKETDNGTSGKENKKKSSSGGLLPVINLVLMLLVLVLGSFIAWKLVALDVPLIAGEEQAPAPKETAWKPGILMELDNVTVNLADTEESRFLRVKIKLDVEGEEDVARIDPHKTEIKDLIISLLSGKSFGDVRTQQGKFALKEELAYRINMVVGGKPGTPVRKVYFSDFVAQ